MVEVTLPSLIETAHNQGRQEAIREVVEWLLANGDPDDEIMARQIAAKFMGSGNG